MIDPFKDSEVLKRIADFVRDCSHSLVLQLTTEGEISYCNQAVCELIGIAEPPVGRSILDVLPGSESLKKRLGQERKSFRARLIVTLAQGVEYAISAEAHPVKGNWLVIAERPMLTHDDYVQEMSSIHQELTNTTRQLSQKNRELTRAKEIIQRMATTDHLTDLANRRYFLEAVEKAAEYSKRHERPASLIMADIDNFKAINDRYGHAVGDNALVAFADCMRNACRKSDWPARYGGEEFIILLPDTRASGSKNLAERIRSEFEATSIPGMKDSVTASFGVASLQADESIPQWIARSDAAMYEAKKTGRNRVCLAKTSTDTASG